MADYYVESIVYEISMKIKRLIDEGFITKSKKSCYMG